MPLNSHYLYIYILFLWGIHCIVVWMDVYQFISISFTYCIYIYIYYVCVASFKRVRSTEEMKVVYFPFFFKFNFNWSILSLLISMFINIVFEVSMVITCNKNYAIFFHKRVHIYVIAYTLGPDNNQ